MFCPKCAEQNLDDAKFCRACGANVSLVPQALTGTLPPDLHTDREKRARGVMFFIISLGLAALAKVILLLAPPNDAWAVFFVTMIAACIMLGIAVGEFVRAGFGERYLPVARRKTSELAPAEIAGELPPARETASIFTSSSVTESTTRSLGAEAPRRRAVPASDAEV